MERFERLSMGLIERLEEQRTVRAQDCPSVVQLEAYVTNKLDSSEMGGLDSHLEGCLPCLNVTVELRDLIAGIEDPEPLSPLLESRLKKIILPQSEKAIPDAKFSGRVGDYMRGGFGWRDVFSWRVLGGALAGVALTFGTMKVLDIRNHFGQGPFPLKHVSEDHNLGKKALETLSGHKSESAVGSGDKHQSKYLSAPPLGKTNLRNFEKHLSSPLKKNRTAPESESTRKFVGIVQSLKKGTMNGSSYYIFKVRTKTNTEYLFLSSGSPEFQVNDQVDVHVLINDSIDKAETEIGIAKKVRKSEQP